MASLRRRSCTFHTKQNQISPTYSDIQPAIAIQMYKGERTTTKDIHNLGKCHFMGFSPALHLELVETTFDIISAKLAQN